jgi:hypothetical protein
MKTRQAGLEKSSTTPIWWPLRIWMGVEVAFGLAAIGAIFLRPQDTQENFAWPIQPVVMAAFLGGFYFASAFLFVPAMFARTWQEVRAIIIPAAVFTTVMLVATVLHWDRFSVGTFPFYVWIASYLLPPPIFAVLYLWHQRRSSPVGSEIASSLPAWVRNFLGTNGLVLTALAALMFVLPSLLQKIGPWDFTPLTVRTLCGWLMAVGLLQFWMSRENDWDRVKLPSAMLMLLPAALIFQLLRFRDQVVWANAGLWVFLADLAVVAVILPFSGSRVRKYISVRTAETTNRKGRS